MHEVLVTILIRIVGFEMIVNKEPFLNFQIVSSLKIPNQAINLDCHQVQEFCGHKDGIWEVTCSRPNLQLIATASAGMLILINAILVLRLPTSCLKSSPFWIDEG